MKVNSLARSFFAYFDFAGILITQGEMNRILAEQQQSFTTMPCHPESNSFVPDELRCPSSFNSIIPHNLLIVTYLLNVTM